MSFTNSKYEIINDMSVGDYIPEVYEVTICEVRKGEHDYKQLDICPKCQKELAEILKNFMKCKT